MDWRENLILDSAEIRKLLSQTKTIAVLGIKTEGQADQPAFEDRAGVDLLRHRRRRRGHGTGRLAVLRRLDTGLGSAVQRAGVSDRG